MHGPVENLWIFKALTFFRLPEAPLRPEASATLATWIIRHWLVSVLQYQANRLAAKKVSKMTYSVSSGT